jgi:hypothetical protein
MRILILIAALLAAGGAKADDFSVGIMPSSHHFIVHGHNYNESHEGKLIEWNFSREDNMRQSIGAMDFINSFDDRGQAIYYGGQYSPENFISFGYQMGLVTGYAYADPLPYGGAIVEVRANKHILARGIILPIVIGFQFVVTF